MRKVRGYTILETEEEIQKYCGCSRHKFKDMPQTECVNPNGEFVIGYGNSPVFVPTESTEKQCVKCGYIRKKVVKNESRNE